MAGTFIAFIHTPVRTRRVPRLYLFACSFSYSGLSYRCDVRCNPCPVRHIADVCLHDSYKPLRNSDAIGRTLFHMVVYFWVSEVLPGICRASVCCSVYHLVVNALLVTMLAVVSTAESRFDNQACKHPRLRQSGTGFRAWHCTKRS